MVADDLTFEPHPSLVASARIVRDEAPVIRSDESFVRDYIYVEDGAAA